MEIEYSKMQTIARGRIDEFEAVRTWLSFSWVCKQCQKINKMDYNKWKFSKGLDECTKCETAYILKEPWGI